MIGYLNLPLEQVSGGFNAEQTALRMAGATQLFIDIDTGHGAAPQLDLALAAIQSGDSLVSLSVHSLARTIDGLLSVNAKLRTATLFCACCKCRVG